MRQFIVLLSASLILSFFTPTAFTAENVWPKLMPVKGAKYAQEWRGTFKVTKCVICEDAKLDSGANLKNLAEFGLDFATIPKDQLPECAKTDLAIAQYFKVNSDDGSTSTFLGKNYGVCDWSPTGSYQFLDLSDEFFHYRKQTRNFSNNVFQEESFTIDKLTDGKYLVHRIIEDPDPKRGLPKKYVYLFEAEKIGSFVDSGFAAKSSTHTVEQWK